MDNSPAPIRSKAPWQATRTYTDKRDPTFSHQDVISGGIRVAVVSGVGMEQAKANAALIASAPDLLAERDRLKAANAELVKALERVTMQYEAYYQQDRERTGAGSLFHDRQIKSARAALASAKGVPPAA